VLGGGADFWERRITIGMINNKEKKKRDDGNKGNLEGPSAGGESLPNSYMGGDGL